MHESKKNLGNAFAELFKQNGYRKRALTWRKGCSDTILVFHAEKDRWGADRYSFHLGIYLRSLGREESPTHYRCPIQTTVDLLVPNSEEFLRISDFEDKSIYPADRLARITEAIDTFAIPWLERYSELPALADLTKCDYAILVTKLRIFRAAYDHLRARSQ